MWRDWFEEMNRFRREMNRLLDTFWAGPETRERALQEFRDLRHFREPLLDIKETDRDLVISLEVPGVDKKDINLNVTENSLELKVEKKAEEKVEKRDYLREERTYKGFYRSVSLPTRVIPEQAKASYKDGILEVVVPKAEKKKVKKVEIE